jgi:hypothetical protein
MRLLRKSGEEIPTDDQLYQRDLTALKFDRNTEQSQKTLQLLHSKYWLQCNCTDHDQNAPVLTIRANPNKTFSLVNISGRGEHKPDCPLSYEKLASQFHVKTNDAFNIADPADVRSLYLLCNMIIERSKLNVLSDSSTLKNNKECVQSIGTNNVTIKGRALEPLFNFGLRSFFAVRDKPHEEGDFIMDIVDEIKDEKGTVELKDSASGKTLFSLFRNITDIYIKADPCPTSKGAYLVLTYVGKNSKTKDQTKITPITALVLPIVSKHHWIMPNHPHFRLMYQSLLNAQTWYRKNNSLDIAITTPIQPLSTLNGTCKPDFIVRNKDRMHLVNLLPDDRNEVAFEPLKCVDILRELGPLTEIDFVGVDNVSNHIFEQNRAIISSLNHDT